MTNSLKERQNNVIYIDIKYTVSFRGNFAATLPCKTLGTGLATTGLAGIPIEFDIAVVVLKYRDIPLASMFT